MDGETMDEIKIFAESKDRRKRIFGKFFKIQVFIALVGALVKKPLLYLLTGHAMKEVDGIGGFMYQSPLAMYFPYADYWGPYIIGMILQHNVCIILATTVMGTAPIYIRFSEELIHQLRIIQLSLRHLIRRAHNLSKTSGNCNGDFDFCLKKCLNATVKHHMLINDLFADFKRWMLFPLFTVIFYSGAMLCLGVLVCLSDESFAVKMSLPALMIAELFNTYVYCGYGEQLTQMDAFSILKFDIVGEQLYNDNWTKHSTILKPYMNIIKVYSNVPKKLSALGFASVNHENFGYILRTTYTFLNFLLNKDDNNLKKKH